jgi:hypothetical protein
MAHQPRRFWGRVGEHVLSNVIAALILVGSTYALIAYYTNSLPSPRSMITSLGSKPYVVWRARAIPNEQLRKSNLFLLKPDRVRARYQLRIENSGESISTSTRAVIASAFKIVSVRAFGDVEFRLSGGNWMPIPSQDKEIDFRSPQVEFRCRALTPGDHVQIELVLERDLANQWQWPATIVSYEHGPAALGLAIPEGDWIAPGR